MPLTPADTLRASAAADDANAERLQEESPGYAEYLARRASWKRLLAEQEERDESQN